jgi:hypothetical protein
MDINSLFSNKIIKNAALGSLKTAMKSNNLRLAVIVYVPDKDELEYQFYSGENVIISQQDLDFYKNSVTELMELKNQL